MEWKCKIVIAVGVLAVIGVLAILVVIRNVKEGQLKNREVKPIGRFSFSFWTLRNDPNFSKLENPPCNSLFQFGNITYINITCFEYRNNPEKVEFRWNENSTSFLSLRPGCYMLRDRRGRLVSRLMASHERDAIIKYYEQSPIYKKYWKKALNKVKAANLATVETERVSIKNYEPIAKDHLYRFDQLPNNLPIILLFRNITFAEGRVAKFAEIPSLVIDYTFSNRTKNETVVIHSPGYFEIRKMRDPTWDYPPFIFTWKKDLFNEMRANAIGEGKLKEFDNMVDLLRKAGVPPPV